MAIKIQVRRDTASAWTSNNPTLSSGEIGWDTTNKKGKVGDGSTAWSSLAYTIFTQAELDAKANTASPTFTGTVIMPTSATGGASIRVPHGAAPTSPTNGDFWTTTSGMFGRINSTTVQFLNENSTLDGGTP